MDTITTPSPWCELFHRWPAELPRRGVLVTTGNEQIPFSGFLASETMIVVERQTPDTVGARKIVIPFASIALVKFCDVVRGRVFQEAGFQGSLT